MKELEPGIPMTVEATAPAIEKLAVLVVGLTAPAGEVVVLLPKDSKLSYVPLLAVILGLDAWLTAHASPLLFLI